MTIADTGPGMDPETVWQIFEPFFSTKGACLAAYYYDSSAKWNRKPVLTYKEESMPANTATVTSSPAS